MFKWQYDPEGGAGMSVSVRLSQKKNIILLQLRIVVELVYSEVSYKFAWEVSLLVYTHRCSQNSRPNGSVQVFEKIKVEIVWLEDETRKMNCKPLT